MADESGGRGGPQTERGTSGSSTSNESNDRSSGNGNSTSHRNSNSNSNSNSGSVDLSRLRDPYEVLGIEPDSSDEVVKAAYRRQALRWHPDKNVNQAELAAEKFKEVAAAYAILSDPKKRELYDSRGFDGLDADDVEVELDLSSMGLVNTMFASMFSKLGVPIKTAIAAEVLDDIDMGRFDCRPLVFGVPVSDKVDKQRAHFFSLRVTEKDSEQGVAIKVESQQQSKFKLLHLRDNGPAQDSMHSEDGYEFGSASSDERAINRSYNNKCYIISMQEDCSKMGKLTTAGFYFFHFPSYRLDSSVNPLTLGDDPEAALFRKLDGYKPREESSLEAGEHVFAIYGDNWFKKGSYKVEAIRLKKDMGAVQSLRKFESEIKEKQTELRTFETSYRLAKKTFQTAVAKYEEETRILSELLAKRDEAYNQFSSSLMYTEPVISPVGEDTTSNHLDQNQDTMSNTESKQTGSKSRWSFMRFNK